jgi:hypothetical protein
MGTDESRPSSTGCSKRTREKGRPSRRLIRTTGPALGSRPLMAETVGQNPVAGTEPPRVTTRYGSTLSDPRLDVGQIARDLAPVELDRVAIGNRTAADQAPDRRQLRRQMTPAERMAHRHGTPALSGSTLYVVPQLQSQPGRHSHDTSS